MKGWQWLLIIGFVLLAAGGGNVAVENVLAWERRLSAAQIYALAVNAGFQGNDAVTAVAVALAESSGDPQALGDITMGGSYGLWQINAHYHPEYGPDFTVLYDPQTNANAAHAIYSAAGSSFSPWSTFKNGAYSAYIPTVQQAIQTA